VFTSLTRAAADYYFLRAGAAHRFVEISFPAEVATHLGWMDMVLSAQNQPRLEAEDDAAVARIQEVLAGGGRAWVYEGYGGALTKVLINRLGSVFPAQSKHALEGPYHTSIIELGGVPVKP
jgi:hypothetical protein